jgi:predicted phosphodiesterase
VHVRTPDGARGWVQRGHLRLKCAAVRRSSGRRLDAHRAGVKSGLGQPEWSKPLFFMQMADSQLGMAETFPGQTAGWAREEELLRRAIAEINRLRPSFAIVCGDLVNEYPGAAGEENLKRAQQTFDFQLACSAVDPSIPLVCVCGNHDVGNRPTPESIELYTGTFGDDYFTFMIDGVKCIVLNSQLYKDASAAPELLAEQMRWLRDELASAETATAAHVLCFCHVPPFVFKPDEPSAYFNLDTDVRNELLSLLASHRVTACFCGHYHRNGGGVYSSPAGAELEVVVTGACGVNVTTKPVGNPLEIEGMGTCREVCEEVSGMRIVRLDGSGMRHEWYTFRDLAQLSPQDASGEGADRPRKKRRKDAP